MGWKTVVIGTECTVSLTLNRMKITIGNEYQNIPLCDLDTVIFSHDRITMTIPMLSKLVENNINVIICDSRMIQLVFFNRLTIILWYLSN